MGGACEIFTIGHGARALDDFLALLAAAHIDELVDVRAFPSSRRHSQFSRAALQPALAECGIEYDWQGRAFGGFRKPRVQSPQLALAHPAFRGFADHMQSAQFRIAAAALLQHAQSRRIALMCAEQRAPAHCHRSLMADFLTLQGARVMHLLDAGSEVHRLHPHARLDDVGPVYDLFGASDELPF